MDRPIVRSGRSVSLGIHERGEIAVMYREFADREVQRFLARPDKLFYLEGEYEWYDNLRKDSNSRVMAILLNPAESGEGTKRDYTLIGNIGLHQINGVSRNAELGYLLFRSYWGKGYGTEAVSLAVNYAFETLNLRKLVARVFEPNRASSRVLEKNGFVLAGRLTEQVYIESLGYVDELYYELLRDR